MKRSFLLRPTLYVVLAILIGGFLIFQSFLAPYLVRMAMNRLITKPCPHCALTVERVTVRFFGPGITLHKVKFMASAGTVTTVSADIPSVTVHMYPFALFQQSLHLGPIEVMNPAVSIVERDLPVHAEAKDEGAKGGSAGPITTLEVDGIVVKRADFNYGLDANRREGIVRVHEIDAHVQRFGTISELTNRKFYGVATGTLEKSGKFELSAAANFFSVKPCVDVELHLVGQHLQDLNAYFHPADRVSLEGELLDGVAQVKIRNVTATSTVSATFKDLKFTVDKNEKRSGFESFLLNLFGALKMGEHNLYDKPQERTKTAVLTRQPDQTVLALILHAMKEAAMKIPSRQRE